MSLFYFSHSSQLPQFMEGIEEWPGRPCYTLRENELPELLRVDLDQGPGSLRFFLNPQGDLALKREALRALIKTVHPDMPGFEILNLDLGIRHTFSRGMAQLGRWMIGQSHTETTVRDLQVLILDECKKLASKNLPPMSTVERHAYLSDWVDSDTLKQRLKHFSVQTARAVLSGMYPGVVEENRTEIFGIAGRVAKAAGYEGFETSEGGLLPDVRRGGDLRSCIFGTIWVSTSYLEENARRLSGTQRPEKIVELQHR